MEYQHPPRYSPDNSPEARKQRMQQFAAAQVVDITSVDRRLTGGSVWDDFAVDHATAYVERTSEVILLRPDIPDISA